MEYEQERHLVSIGSILYGTLVSFVVNLVLTILLAILTELGWPAVVKPYSNNLYLIMGNLAVISGAIAAGRESRTKGWLTGLGVGIAGSIVFAIVNTFTGQPLVWGIFLIKMLLNGFVGIFGGIIGINLPGSKR